MRELFLMKEKALTFGSEEGGLFLYDPASEDAPVHGEDEGQLDLGLGVDLGQEEGGHDPVGPDGYPPDAGRHVLPQDLLLGQE